MIAIKKTVYSVEYNPVSKTWCLYKNLESSQSLNFYPIVQSEKKQDCIKKLEEIKKKEKENHKKKVEMGKAKKGERATYRLYYEDKLVDTDTKENLIKKYKDLRHNVFYPYYFYKRKEVKYRVEKVGTKNVNN